MVSNRTTFHGLGRMLVSDDPSTRLDAAKRMVEIAREGRIPAGGIPRIRAWLECRHPETRLAAALALLYGADRQTGYPYAAFAVESVVFSAGARCRNRTLSAVVTAALSMDEPSKAYEPLKPILSEALNDSSPVMRRATLFAWWYLVRSGVDPGRLIEALGGLLPDLDDEGARLAADILWHVAMSGRGIEPALKSLTSRLDSADGPTAYLAAACLAWHAVVAEDDTLLASLLSHPSSSVREGSIGSITEAAKAGRDISAALPQLGHLLDDPSGAVVHGVIEALTLAVCRGFDLSPVVGPLERSLDAIQYSTGGWTFGMDLVASNDLASEDARSDVAAILIEYWRRNDPSRLQGLLSRLDPSVRRRSQEIWKRRIHDKSSRGSNPPRKDSPDT